MAKNLPPPRVLPWACWEEWETVHGALQASVVVGHGVNPEAAAPVVERVCGWRARGSLPLAVDATAQLLELLALHGGVTEVSRRLALSMAVVRVVNGITDGKQKGKVAASVASVAEAIGVPRWVVDIRHEASHNALPDLPVAEAAALAMLGFLVDRYWTPQAASLAEARSRSCLLTALAAPSPADALTTELSAVVVPDGFIRDVLVPALLDGGEAFCGLATAAATGGADLCNPRGRQTAVLRWVPAVHVCAQASPAFIPALALGVCGRVADTPPGDDGPRVGVLVLWARALTSLGLWQALDVAAFTAFGDGSTATPEAPPPKRGRTRKRAADPVCAYDVPMPAVYHGVLAERLPLEACGARLRGSRRPAVAQLLLNHFEASGMPATPPVAAEPAPPNVGCTASQPPATSPPAPTPAADMLSLEAMEALLAGAPAPTPATPGPGGCPAPTAPALPTPPLQPWTPLPAWAPTPLGVLPGGTIPDLTWPPPP